MFGGSGSFALALACLAYVVAAGQAQMEMISDKKPTKCTHERAYGMYGAYCAGLRLGHIPSLRSSIEILDFSENRLQEIKSDTFSPYTSIKFLYLAENQLFSIDREAFAALTSLQTLDLSNNVILSLPETIFQLPSLRKLNLKNNPVLHLSLNNIQLQKPIKAPLELLDISSCRVETLPSWGTLPYLTHYNISHNPLKALDPGHFAPMCKLEKVDMSNSIDEIKVCDIKPTIAWLESRKVYFQLKNYNKLNTQEFADCPFSNFEALNATHHSCKTVYLKLQNFKTSRRTWLTVTGGLAGFLVGFILLLYLMHRHNVAQTRTRAEKLKKSTPAHDRDMHATVPILAAADTDARDGGTLPLKPKLQSPTTVRQESCPSAIHY